MTVQRNLTSGSVFKNIVYFSLPYLLSYFLQTLYGMADLFITGQYNQAEVITAVSIGSQVMHMITVIIVGLAMGSTVMISQSVGAGKNDRSAKTIGNTVTIFMIVSIIFTIGLIGGTHFLVKAVSTPKESISQTRMYLTICFAGIPFITAYNVLSAIFRGMGDSKSPMYFISIACVINIIIDYILIGRFGMGATGAALGTVLSQALSVLIALCTIMRRKLGINISKNDFSPGRETVFGILKIGVPVALQDGFIQVSFMVITIIANKRGVDVAAAVGIVEKIIGFLFLVPSTMLSSISAIAAQNVGAGLYKRATQTLWYGIAISVTFGLIVGILCQFSSEQIISLFSDESAVIEFGGQYFRSYVFDCALAAIHFCFSGYFCAYGLSVISFIHNAASILIARIPLAYLASQKYPDNLLPMGAAAPIGSLVSDIICVVALIWFIKRYRYKDKSVTGKDYYE